MLQVTHDGGVNCHCREEVKAQSEALCLRLWSILSIVVRVERNETRWQ